LPNFFGIDRFDTILDSDLAPSASNSEAFVSASLSTGGRFQRRPEGQPSNPKRRRLNTRIRRGRFFLSRFRQIRLPLTSSILLDSNPAPSNAQSLLVKEFERHRSASEEFPPVIPLETIRSAIKAFIDSLQSHSKLRVCSCCGVFCPSSDTMTLDNGEPCLRELKRVGLDRCGCESGVWSFCKSCYADVLRSKVPKFSSLNLVNVVMCGDYPAILEDLTLVEECVIARRHPVGSILKLRPGNRQSPSNYYALYGHIIVFPQEPGTLLQILPSPTLRFQDIIKVFWVGKLQPSPDDLKPFLKIRKHQVLAALLWLVTHNRYYHDLTINHSLLSSWPAEFIPEQISANITYIEVSDHTEREGYVANLETGNFENDLQATTSEIFPDNDARFSSGSICTDINGERVNCDLHLLNTLTSVLEKANGNPDDVSSDLGSDFEDMRCDSDNESTNIQPPEHPSRPGETSNYIRYGCTDSTALSNSWEDPQYFATAFPTLFPTGLGGHLDERSVKVSLEAFGKWALSHHSRRQVIPLSSLLLYHRAVLEIRFCFPC
jgi:hypothetical protein